MGLSTSGFRTSDDVQALADEIIQFAQDELVMNLVERDQQETFLHENWKAIADRGLLGLCMPEEYGGSGYDITTSVRLLEALGYGCRDNGLTLGVNAIIWTVQIPILKFGSDLQKEKYLRGLVDGSLIGGDAVTEPDSGSDALSLQTLAKKVDGGYVLNGHKYFIGLSSIADVFIVFATQNPAVGRWGVSAFLVDGDSEGLVRDQLQSKMGLRTEPMGHLMFNDVFVPEENLLGREGSGAAIFNDTMQYERGLIFASHVGSIARQLDQTVQFARQRRVGGQAIGKYQSVSNRIANMKVRLETARMFMYRVAAALDAGQDAMMDAAMAKLVISESLLESSLDAVRVHGGQGYLSEHEIERDVRDTLGGVLYGGTSDIQRNVIAGLLGL